MKILRAFKYSFILALLPFAPLSAQEASPVPDLLTFAQGVLPVSIAMGEADLRVTMTQAIASIDGNSTGFVMTQRPGVETDSVEIIYALPTPTRFARFAVPSVFETPSPSQTFYGEVEILGATESGDGPFVRLASGNLELHENMGEVTELALAPDQPDVLWVKLRLSNGLRIERDKTYFEFSEIIGNGVQQLAALSERFNGVWDGRGVDIELAQDGATVTGCYDTESKLAGTVSGNVLRALGTSAAGIDSQFILIATADGGLRGLRSTNGAPFKPYDGAASTGAPVCLPPEPPTLGCGAVVHGIGFDYDSDVIRPESARIIAALYDGLSAAAEGGIRIVGHSSSEGQADYNRDLSARRAQAVVAALVALGLDPAHLSADGRGEDEPIASNGDEAGRSLNRRVEVQCAG